MLEGDHTFVSGAVYQVFAKHDDRDRELGFARAETLADLEAFFDDRKGYGLVVKPIKSVTVPCGLADRKRSLKDKMVALDHEMNLIRREIEKL